MARALHGPGEGATISELMRMTSMKSPTLFRRLAEHASTRLAIQGSRGQWCDTTAEAPQVIVSRLLAN